MSTIYEDILNLFREIAEDRKTTERQLKAMAEETDRRFQETDRQIKAIEWQFGETDKKIAEVNRVVLTSKIS